MRALRRQLATLGYGVLLAATFIGVFAVLAIRRYGSEVSPGALALLAIALLYAAAGVLVARQTDESRVLVLTIGARMGLLLGAIEVLNIVLEESGALSGPARAIVPASAMGLMIVVFATAAAIARSVAPSVALTFVSAVWSAFVAMSLSCALGIIIVPTLAGGSSGELINLIGNASSHMLISLLIATGVAAVVCVVDLASSRARATVISLLLGLSIALLAGGIIALVYASSLERSKRPPFVMSGMLAAALALAAGPPLVGNLLGRQAPQIEI